MDEPVTTSAALKGPSDRAIVFFAILIFIGQVGVLAWLGGVGLDTKKTVMAPELKLMPEILLIPDHGAGAPFSDPMLFTRPNRRGFSGAAWRSFDGVEHQLIEWDEPGRPLANEPGTLGARFRKALPNHMAFVTDIPAKRLAKPMEVVLPPLAMRATSEIEVRGRLAKRPLVRKVAVPGWSHGEALQRTHVRIGVNPDGYVVSTTLPGRLAKPGSLQAAADQRALDLLRGIRFQPAPGAAPRLPGDASQLEWGEAIFHWQTVAPPKPPPVTPAPVLPQT